MKSYIIFYKISRIVFFTRVFALYATIISLNCGTLPTAVAVTDPQGEPVVHRVDGQYPESHYLDNTEVKVSDGIV